MIIGIGSPIADDDLGWQTVDILLENKKIRNLVDNGLQLIKLDRPGVMLAKYIEDYEHVIIVDAAKPANSNAQPVWLDINKLNSPGNNFSSHEIGLSHSIQYIKAIGRLPKDITLLAITKIDEEQLINKVLRCLNF